MTLKQLRCLCEVVQQGLNLSRAARTLHTSQPAITKMIRALESELDVQLLVRVGARIVSLTDEGKDVVAFARQVLQDVHDLRLAATDSRDAGRGTLRIGTTNLQARYALIDVIRRFVLQYPDVDLTLCQGTPGEIARWVSDGEVDVGISTVPQALPRNVLKLEAYEIHRCIAVPRGHPLSKVRRPTLAQLARHRLIAHDNQLATGAVVRKAFEAAHIAPRITLRTADADLLKSYVKAGLGVAVIQKMAVDDAKEDRALHIIDAGHLFASSTAWITVRRDQYLRRYMYDFIALVAPRWTRSEIEQQRARKTPPAKARSGRAE